MKTVEGYDFSNLKNQHFFNMVIFGTSNSGKTLLTKHVLNSVKGKFNHVYLFIGSPKGVDNNYNNYIWDNHIININENSGNTRKYLLSKLNEIKVWLKDISDKYSENNKAGEKPHVLLIFDDLNDNLRSKELTEFITQNRHVNTSCIFLIHSYRNLEPSMRSSLTHYVLAINSSHAALLENITNYSKATISDMIATIDQNVIKFKTKNKLLKKEYIENHNGNQEGYYDLKGYHVIESDTDNSNLLYFFELNQNFIKDVFNSTFLFSTDSKIRLLIMKELKNLLYDKA